MTPLELVLGSVVKTVTVSVNDGTPTYRVLVKLPDGKEHRVSTRYKAFARRICKKAGLKMTTKATKAVALVLNDKILQAVEDFKADPETANRIHKARSRAAVNTTRKAERREKARQAQMREQMLALMIALRISLEELTEIWQKSVVKDVMTS